MPVRIDLRRLRQTARECGWSLSEFSRFYAPRARAELAQIEEAHAAGDEDALARLAHGAAGSSESVGMTSLAVSYRRSANAASLSESLALLQAHLVDALRELDELARSES